MMTEDESYLGQQVGWAQNVTMQDWFRSQQMSRMAGMGNVYDEPESSKEPKPSEFQQYSNHEFNKLLDEFQMLT